ncbi:MAG: glycosyltransferase family 4 protein [Candidatus Omnitrophica bacterium]|jgi:glycosyltransferase involved in cell wall biosynthesis|nr:glycosyltransferase family 4 protein [Candidatus Omnitrophota bacterium]
MVTYSCLTNGLRLTNLVEQKRKRKTGYAAVANNIIKNLCKTGKYDIAQLGFSDIPIPVGHPIDYYSQLKDHTGCCKKGYIIEYVSKDNPQVRYFLPQLNGPDLIEHPDHSSCIKAPNFMQDHYGYDSSYFVIQHFKPDIVIPINDIWGLYNLNHLKNRPCYKFMPYLAIDSECLFPTLIPPENRPGLPPIDTIKTIGMSDKPIVFTEWAKNVINKTCRIVTGGRELTNISVIPHGVDTSVWKPLSLDRKKELREKYFDITDNTFLLGCVSRCQPRKRQDAILMSMRKFIDKGYEKNGRKIKCYFHCSLEDTIGWDLQWLVAYYNLQDRVIFDKNLKPGLGPTEEQLNEIINCFDSHILLSNSEGFALTLIESISAGIPTITTKYSAMADWGKGTLMFVDPADIEHEPRTNFIKAIADTSKAALQIKRLYDSKELCKEYSQKGISLAKKLDWVNVCKQWEEILDNTDISNFKEDRYLDPAVIPEVQPPTQDFSQYNIKYLPDRG